PPLYRIDIGKQTHWAADDASRDRILDKHGKGARVDITRFKGLGEMMPNTLKETTLDPENRRLLRVTIPEEAKLETELTISDLMGKDAAPRYEFIMEHAADVEELDV
ncbi:MAG: DNA topoisomerase IV subunit B, partial [Rubricoccaceae bacterium]|nr:DNA topoisomerase IV subunit B [Rubricoccaceae bacterium]